MKTLIHTTLTSSTTTIIGTYAKNKQYRRARAKHVAEICTGPDTSAKDFVEHTYTHTPIRGYRVRSHVIVPTGKLADLADPNDVYLLITHHDDKPIPRATLNAVVKAAAQELHEAYND